MSFTNWVFGPPSLPKIGDSLAETLCVDAGPSFVEERDVRSFNETMDIAIGKRWKEVPMQEMLNIVNFRFSTKPIDYSSFEIKQTMELLIDLVNGLSEQQKKFLLSNDHLPRAKEFNGKDVWLDGKELEAYEAMDDAIQKRKTEYFLMTNGIIQAFRQKMGQNTTAIVPDKPFELKVGHVVAVVIVLSIILLVWLEI